jgi:uncharacterized membrane protein YagU involved in acid resistance
MKKLNITKAIASGFAGTLAMSVIMIVKKLIGIMPSLDPIAMIAEMAHAKAGLPDIPLIGWVMHFIIGSVVFGILYAIVNPKLKGPETVKGITFGLLAWLAMMIIVMPMAGVGLFGLSLGIPAPVLTMMLHVVYGAVLGAAYGKR